MQIVSGADGLLGGSNLPNHATAAIDTFGSYVSEVWRLRASMAGSRRACRSVKVLMGSAGYAHAGSVYRGDQSQESAIDRLMTITAVA